MFQLGRLDINNSLLSKGSVFHHQICREKSCKSLFGFQNNPGLLVQLCHKFILVRFAGI